MTMLDSAGGGKPPAPSQEMVLAVSKLSEACETICNLGLADFGFGLVADQLSKNARWDMKRVANAIKRRQWSDC